MPPIDPVDPVDPTDASVPADDDDLLAPADPTDAIEQLTSFCEALTREVPAYDLHFVPTPEVAGFLEKEIPR